MFLTNTSPFRMALGLGGLLLFTLGGAVGTASQPEKGAGSLPDLQNPVMAFRKESPKPYIPADLDPSMIQDRADQLARLGGDSWQAAGYRGQGIKIAVLDSGFRGYRKYLGKELPSHITVRSFRPDGNLEARDSQHGILCAEVLHALAPDADLLLANWSEGSPDSFLAAVRWAREEGARIITSSVITPDWSDGQGGGAVHEALTRILGSGNQAGDVLFFASAGNTAERHWMGRFHAGPDGYHQWQPGREDNVLTPWGDDPVQVELYCPPEAGYELSVYDVSTNTEVGQAATALNETDRHVAVATFSPRKNHVYRARVRLTRGTPGLFHLVALSSDSLHYATPQGSVSFPADGSEVIAVGAVDAEGHRWSYSSCGSNGLEAKPDFVTPVPFPSYVEEDSFSGTSAASPQGAALAALWWSRHPQWNAARVHEALKTSAHHLGPREDEWETGYGLLTLPRV